MYLMHHGVNDGIWKIFFFGSKRHVSKKPLSKEPGSPENVPCFAVVENLRVSSLTWIRVDYSRVPKRIRVNSQELLAKKVSVAALLYNPTPVVLCQQIIMNVPLEPLLLYKK